MGETTCCDDEDRARVSVLASMTMDRPHHHGISPFEERYGFSRAIRVGSAISVAGTAPVPEPGRDQVAGAYEQMLRCVEIATEAIEGLGGSIDEVVRTRMFIVDPDDADAVGRAHAEAFGAASPAATMVVVAGLLDPAWRIELEVDAVVGAGE